MAEITVIIPVYNVEKYLKRCVDSIIASTFENWDLILIDDGSLDNSGKICDEYSIKEKRIKVIHQENGGASKARNTGIQWAMDNSSSEWITFVDSDDWILSTYLEELYNVAKRKKVLISVCNYLRVSDEEIPNNIAEGVREMTPEQLYCKKNIQATMPCGKLFLKELFSDIRFPVGRRYEDEATMYKILFKLKRLVYLEKPLYMYYLNAESVMLSKWNIKKLDIIVAVEEQLSFFYENKYRRAYLKAARYYFRVLNDAIGKIEKYCPEHIDIKEDLENRKKKYKRKLAFTLGRLFLRRQHIGH